MMAKFFKLKKVEPSSLRTDRLPRWKRIDINNNTKQDITDKEKLFIELMPHLIVKEDRQQYPHSIFYFKTNNKGKRLIFEYNEKTLQLLCSFNLISNKFSSQFLMNQQEIKEFLKAMATKYLLIKKCKPEEDLQDKLALIEKQFLSSI